MIEYKIENDLSLEEFKAILEKSTLAERRPMNEPDRLQKMLEHGNLIITARDNGKIVGVARSITDFHYATYLSELAVDKAYQKKGIGKELIKQTKLNAPKALLILLSAPAAVHFYPKVGMKRHEHCYLLRDVNELQ